MDRWEAPRRGGNQGEGSEPLRGEGARRRRAWAPEAPWAPPGPCGWRGGWRGSLGGVRARAPWAVAGRGAATGRIYVCLWARGALSRVDFVDWGGRWCGSLSSTHSIYISTQCNDPRQSQPRRWRPACPPGDAARGAALPRGRTGGLGASPCKRNLSMSSSNGGRRAEGRRLPGPSRPRGPSHRAFNGGDGA